MRKGVWAGTPPEGGMTFLLVSCYFCTGLWPGVLLAKGLTGTANLSSNKFKEVGRVAFRCTANPQLSSQQEGSG